jgi:hypothetical protein
MVCEGRQPTGIRNHNAGVSMLLYGTGKINAILVMKLNEAMSVHTGMVRL